MQSNTSKHNDELTREEAELSDRYRSMRDLEPFGIIPLTGEACGISMRHLFDLTEQGVEIIRNFMRVEPTQDGWNSGVKSIMIPRSMLQELWVFCHVMRGTKYVFMGGYVNPNQWDATLNATPESHMRHPDTTWEAEAYAIDDDDLMRLGLFRFAK